MKLLRVRLRPPPYLVGLLQPTAQWTSTLRRKSGAPPRTRLRQRVTLAQRRMPHPEVPLPRSAARRPREVLTRRWMQQALSADAEVMVRQWLRRRLRCMAIAPLARGKHGVPIQLHTQACRHRRQSRSSERPARRPRCDRAPCREGFSGARFCVAPRLPQLLSPPRLEPESLRLQILRPRSPMHARRKLISLHQGRCRRGNSTRRTSQRRPPLKSLLLCASRHTPHPYPMATVESTGR